MPDLQEILALAIVVLVAGLYWHRRRRRPANSCGDCASAGPPAAESTIRFYRRNPETNAQRPPEREQGPQK
jgi:hypothetical protein